MVTIVIVSALSPYQELKTFKSGQISKEKNGSIFTGNNISAMSSVSILPLKNR